ncbi:adenosylcobinamide-GDP ribazoletransferase [Roseomonas sp. USHLN139]|uniref:adenosylcobinamide-GDP ribazoletransferase n=1 Tax=Roseomonas sp. USHLN139 TaxID=3081298 RepID=UPI003B012E3E
MRERLAELGAAFGLLTRLPVGWLPQPGDPAGYARAVWAYPLAGALLGALAGGVQAGLAGLGVAPAMAAPWAIAVLLLASGALHEDGLADMADGFGGGRDRERKLAIMRDSRIGSFGALALVLALGCRGVALSEAVSPVALMAGAGALGRGAMLVPLVLLRPARSDGLGAGLGRPPVWAFGLGGVLAVALGMVLLPWWAAVVALGAGGVVALLAWRQVGGHTGDVLGASAVLAELAVLSVA